MLVVAKKKGRRDFQNWFLQPAANIKPFLDAGSIVNLGKNLDFLGKRYVKEAFKCII